MIDATLHGQAQETKRIRRLTSADRSSIFAVKSLYYPVVAVLTLLACLVLWRQPLFGPNFLFAALVFVVVSNSLGIAQLERVAGDPYGLRALSSILQRWCLVVGFIWAVLHLSRLTGAFRFEIYCMWAVATPAVLWLGQIGLQHALISMGARPRHHRNAVIVGLTDLGLRLERHLKESLLATEVVGYFEDRTPDRLPAATVARILGTPAVLPEYIARHDISVVYITLPMTRHPRILDMLNALRDSTVSIYFVPDLFIFDLIQARFDVIAGMPVVAVRETPFYGARAIAKRLCDLAISAALLVLLAPVLLAIAAGVRRMSPGPVLFKQRRYGLDGREIIIYKFRSMTVMEDGAAQYTQVTRHDSRVPPFGTFIRKFSLDELPQLINVLKGNLSIVGPRPHAVAVNEQYRKLIPGYMVRHKVKPGITGWAQINGYRGGDDLESMRKRIEFDLDYLRHWSLGLDLAIIFRTAALVWNDRKAF